MVKVIFHSTNKRLQLKPFIMHHKVMQQGCFFLSLFSCKFDDQLNPNFHRFVSICICWVGIHQVRITVFDNYQTCPMPLTFIMSCLLGHIAGGNFTGNKFQATSKKRIHSHLTILVIFLGILRHCLKNDSLDIKVVM